MSQSKNLPTTTTGTGVALKNASRSLKITNKLLSEIIAVRDEDWEWWNSLNSWRKFVLFENSINSFSPSSGYFHWSVDEEANFNNDDLLKILKLTKVKIVFDPELTVDISFLKPLKNLTQLHIGYIWIIRVSHIFDFRYTLNHFNNPFSNFYDTDMDILRKNYFRPRENYGVINYEIINQLRKLEYLYLNDDNLTNIDFLYGLDNLKGITIHGNIKNQNIFDYINISNLEVFCYSNGLITRIEQLTQAEKLQILYLSNNCIEEFYYCFPNLKRLNINHNNIYQISIDIFSPNLEHICINDNYTHSINNFINIPNLISLDLTNNYINDIAEVSYLKSLKYLVLDNNLISDISVIANLESLSVLSLSDNQLSSIPDLSNTNLEELYLKNNNINDISSLASLKSLKFLVLKGNPISNTSIEWLKNQLPNCHISFFAKDTEYFDFRTF